MSVAGLRSTAELWSDTSSSVEPVLTHWTCLRPVSTAARPLSTHAVTVDVALTDMNLLFAFTVCQAFIVSCDRQVTSFYVVNPQTEASYFGFIATAASDSEPWVVFQVCQTTDHMQANLDPACVQDTASV